MKEEENPGKLLAVFNAMSLMISSNWENWEIHANVKGFCAYPKLGIPIENFGVFHCGKLIAFRCIQPAADAAMLMKEIAGAFNDAQRKTRRWRKS